MSDLHDLARHLVTLPRWRWLPRMVDQHGRTVIDVNDGRNAGVPVEWSHPTICRIVEMYEHPNDARAEWADAIPDLTDPATLGCLLALVREAYTAPHAHTRYSRSYGQWEVMLRHNLCRDLCGPTEAAALVAALEAAP
jgi:hypothetical protein